MDSVGNLSNPSTTEWDAIQKPPNKWRTPTSQWPKAKARASRICQKTDRYSRIESNQYSVNSPTIPQKVACGNCKSHNDQNCRGLCLAECDPRSPLQSKSPSVHQYSGFCLPSELQGYHFLSVYKIKDLRRFSPRHKFTPRHSENRIPQFQNLNPFPQFQPTQPLFIQVIIHLLQLRSAMSSACLLILQLRTQVSYSLA